MVKKIFIPNPSEAKRRFGVVAGVDKLKGRLSEGNLGVLALEVPI